MVEELMSTYHVAYDRDEAGWWVASVREVRGCHTQGRTVDETRRRIREAMELFVDDAQSAKVVDEVKLPTAATKAIRVSTLLRKRAAREGQTRICRGASRGSTSEEREAEDERTRCGSCARHLTPASVPTCPRRTLAMNRGLYQVVRSSSGAGRSPQ